MSEITIDSHVQAPAPKEKKEYRKTLDNLKIGESFLAPLGDRQNISSTIGNYFHTVGVKRFTTSVKDQPDGMFRTWRIADEIKEQTN